MGTQKDEQVALQDPMLISGESHERTTSPGEQYRYDHFSTKLLVRDLRFQANTPAPGDALPEFEVYTSQGERRASQEILGEKPLLLVFGSMTCPMTASSMPSLSDLFDEFGEHIDFMLVNVREAHPGEN